MTTTTANATLDPEQVLQTLINFLVGEYRDAVSEYGRGRRHFDDRDHMRLAESPLLFLSGISGGRYGLSVEQLEAVRAEVEATR